MANYKSSTTEFNSGPPKAVDVLAHIFEKWQGHSKHFPSRPYDAAHWWMDHQEPANEFTERLEEIKDGWKTPYIDRVAGTLRIFLKLDEPFKAFVIEKIESGIPWRGDNMAMFMNIIQETEKMLADRDKYIRAATGVLEDVRSASQ